MREGQAFAQCHTAHREFESGLRIQNVVPSRGPRALQASKPPGGLYKMEILASARKILMEQVFQLSLLHHKSPQNSVTHNNKDLLYFVILRSDQA